MASCKPFGYRNGVRFYLDGSLKIVGCIFESLRPICCEKYEKRGENGISLMVSGMKRDDILKFVVIVYTMVIYSSNVWWSSKSLNECQREVIAKIFAVFPSFFSPPAKNCHHVAIVNYSVPPSYNSNFVRVSRLRRWYKVNFEFSSSFFDRKSIIFPGEYKYLETIPSVSNKFSRKFFKIR